MQITRFNSYYLLQIRNNQFSQGLNNFYCFLKHYSKMNNKAKYQQTIQRMQRSIKRLDQQLARSRLLTHDITIDNKTDKNLDLIIKVQDDFDNQQVSKSESRVSIPQRTTYRHRISSSRQKSIDKDQSQIRNRFNQRSLEREMLDPQSFDQRIIEKPQFGNLQISQTDKSSPVRLQRKFQPFSHIISMKNGEKDKNKQMEILKDSGVQTEYDLSSPYSHFSEIKQQEGLNFQKQPEKENAQRFFLKTPETKIQGQKAKTIQSTRQRFQSQRNEKVPLPVSVFENSFHNNQNEENQKQMAEKDIKDAFIVDETLNISFSKIQRGNNKAQNNEKKGWRVQPLIIGYKNSKKYFETSNQRQSFGTAKKNERQNKLGLNASKNIRNRQKSKASSSSKQKERSFISRFQIKKPTIQSKQKANDLFLERKALLLHNLQKPKPKAKQSHQTQTTSRAHAKTYYISQFTSTNINAKQKRKNQISPKALEVSERLYSRSKGKFKPCDHYQRYSQSIERQRFEQLVRQSSFINQKMTEEEKQCVFQSLRSCEDSVSTWPMVLLKYTYSKFEKVKVYKQSKKKILH